MEFKSDWKKKQLVTQGTSNFGTVNTISHTLVCGIRLNYESWIALPGADTFFYDTNLPNNGLNLNSSRFDDSPFEVVVRLDAAITDDSKLSTNYTFLSQPFEVESYGEDGNVPAGWAGVIELQDSNSNPVPVVLSNQNTKIVFTFTKDAAAPLISDLWARIRMYKENSSNISAFEISTYELPLAAPNPLIPIAGETQLKTTKKTQTRPLDHPL